MYHHNPDPMESHSSDFVPIPNRLVEAFQHLPPQMLLRLSYGFFKIENVENIEGFLVLNKDL